MNFICNPCKDAADDRGTEINALEFKRIRHSECKGATWCDCQHRVGRPNK